MRHAIGCTTRPYRDLPYAEAFAKIAAAGFTDVAVFSNQGQVPVRAESTADEVRAVKRAAVDAGVAPSMVIGGALGGVVGNLFHKLIPTVVTQPGAFVIVGMAGFFSAASHAPISTIIMVSEMTGNYNLLVPAMWVCAIAYIVGRRWSIYENQVSTRADSPAHYGDFVKDLPQKPYFFTP